MLATGHHLHQPGSTSMGLFVTQYSANIDYRDRDFSSLWSPPTTVSWNPVGNTVILPPVYFWQLSVGLQSHVCKDNGSWAKKQVHNRKLSDVYTECFSPTTTITTADYWLSIDLQECVLHHLHFFCAQAINIDTTNTRPTHKNCFFFFLWIGYLEAPTLLLQIYHEKNRLALLAFMFLSKGQGMNAQAAQGWI